MKKQDYINRTSWINKYLIGNCHARSLFQMVVIKAEKKPNSEYMKNFKSWLKKGGTVLLRDDLCTLFESNFEKRLDFFYGFDHIDTAGMRMRMAIK